MPALLWQTSMRPWRSATACVEGGHGVVVGDVDGEGGGLAGQVGGGPLGGREVDVGDGDEAALLGQTAAGGEADAGGTACDDADLSLDASGHGRH